MVARGSVPDEAMKGARKIVVYIATSADGYIARPDGDVAWLDRPRPKGDYGMGDFLRSVDTILWGRKTYEVGLEFGGGQLGYGPTRRNYVFSRRPWVLSAGSRVRPGADQTLRWAPSICAGQGYLDDGRRRNHRLVLGRGSDRRI